MSRGHGAVEREILHRLDIPTIETWTTIADLAGEGATRSRIESVRRAVLKLRDAGLVDVTTVSRQIGGITRYPQAARLALDEGYWGENEIGDPIRRRRRGVERETAAIKRMATEADLQKLRRKLHLAEPATTLKNRK